MIRRHGAPAWTDEEAVVAWVDEQINEAIDPIYEMSFDAQVPNFPRSWYRESIEREAVEAARRGNFRQLAKFFKLAPSDLSQEARELIAQRLVGEYKARRGRPKQDPEERRAASPVHNAATDFLEIKGILDQWWPEERGRRDRAIAIAADKAGIEFGTLFNYLKSNRRLP